MIGNNMYLTIMKFPINRMSPVESRRARFLDRYYLLYIRMICQMLYGTRGVSFSLMIPQFITYTSDDLNTTATILTNELDQLTEWFRANKLSLSATKTNYILFNNTQLVLPDIELKIGTDRINRVYDTTFLGVYIDSKLNWNKRLQYCSNKLSSGLYAIRNVKHLLPKPLKSLYYTLTHPYLNYGTIIWGSAAKKVT